MTILRIGMVIAALAVFSNASAQTESEWTVFENVNLLTMAERSDRPIRRNQTVFVQGDRIAAVAPAGILSIPQGARRIDGTGKYLLPGLAEMHGHVPPLQSFQGVPDRYLDDALFLYIAGGVTTVRGMLGHPHQLQLKQDIADGTRVGPTLYLAGPSFNGNTVTSPLQARERVREHKQEGWDLLKIHPGLTLRNYEALAEEARTLGIDFAGHVPEDVGIRHAIILGSRTIDHLDGYMAEVNGFEAEVSDDALRELAQFTRAHQVGVVPTMALWETIIGAADKDALLSFEELKYVPTQVRQGWKNFLAEPRSQYYTGDTARIHAENRRRLLAIMHEEGVEILLGTDAPQLFSVPGLSMRREIPHMLAAGMSPYDVIYSGTVAVGRYFQEEDNFGQVIPDQRADLLLVSDNPLTNIETLYTPEWVMVRGELWSRAQIDEKLAEIERAYQEEQE
ncbi:amidohydrolase family protein [Aliidiomarina halalkaliphila]|uniref:Amidohydrolase family protein n=1 Tax=Aliidiomarina halalkaliphila TaxID=2593535 RepID=A0A552X1N9_9GAMM|nr:amidohydrolase family protein [Aliidiomarina halalkaliphila]TRW48799.1 amidohydrolase family protein [Aliidiomarina halalkaliphila]